MSGQNLMRWTGAALIAWALHLLVKDYTFAFTHGTMEEDMSGVLVGISARQFALIWTVFGLLGTIGVSGVYVQVRDRLSWFGRIGFLIAIVGLAMLFLSWVMQYWILNPDAYFHSPVVYGGWLLSIAAVLVVTPGLIMAGLDVARANALPGERFLILIIGVLWLPSAILHPLLVGQSDGSLASKLLYGSLSVPLSLCWLRLGFVQHVVVARAPTTVVE